MGAPSVVDSTSRVVWSRTRGLTDGPGTGGTTSGGPKVGTGTSARTSSPVPTGLRRTDVEDAPARGPPVPPPTGVGPHALRCPLHGSTPTPVEVARLGGRRLRRRPWTPPGKIRTDRARSRFPGQRVDRDFHRGCPSDSHRLPSSTGSWSRIETTTAVTLGSGDRLRRVQCRTEQRGVPSTRLPSPSVLGLPGLLRALQKFGQIDA